MTLKKIHFISGLTLTVFIGVHLFNHFVGIFGAAAHIDVMDKLRVVYRNIFVESILLVAILVQIYSGIKLFLSKRKAKNAFFDKLQIWSGLYLAFFLLMHVGAVLMGRHVLKLDTNFYFGVAGLNVFPFNLFFIPYYSLAIISFFGHIAAIHSKKMKSRLLGLSVEQQSKFILVKGIILAVIILYGLTNGFAGEEIPQEYNIMIGR